jgi:hypothetical protein
VVIGVGILLFGGKISSVMGTPRASASGVGMKEPEEEAAGNPPAQVTPRLPPDRPAGSFDCRSRRRGATVMRITSHAGPKTSRRWRPRCADQRLGAAHNLRPIANGFDPPNHRLQIRNDPLKGRGVFAEIIAAGTVTRPLRSSLHRRRTASCSTTIVHDYYFSWDADPGGEESGAVALGLVSLCNHSRRPRARVRRNVAQGTLDLVALVPIAAGDEVTIDYNCPLWFKAHD